MHTDRQTNTLWLPSLPSQTCTKPDYGTSYFFTYDPTRPDNLTSTNTKVKLAAGTAVVAEE